MGRLDIDIRGKVVPADVVAAIAARQHGVIARRQLFDAGLTRATIDRLVRTGWLHPLHRGVYAAGHRGVGPRGRELAAVLWAGAEHAVGRRSAAAMWGALPAWRGDVQVIGARSKRTRGVVVHKARSLPRSDVTRHYGIPVTTPARTLIDLATVVDLETLEAALAEAQIRGLIRPEARLIVEVDGWRYHSTRQAFEADRRRDAVLQAAGWRVVRVTDRQLTRETAERLARMCVPAPPRAA